MFLSKAGSKIKREEKANKSSQQNAVYPKKDTKLTVLQSFGYTVRETIGTGSFAKVKVAFSEYHDGDVAIKIIARNKASKQYLDKFLPRELEVVKRLKHENLIHFHQAIETNLRVYIIMEFAEKGTILEVIKKDKYIDEGRARQWFYQLTSAVDYCHRKGVAHRDIKCDNILMSNTSSVKLSDFGFARGNMKPIGNVYPLSTTYCGSYAYASPEVLKGIPYWPIDADIWSMGVVLFAIVFGRLPFDDSDYVKLIKQVDSRLTFPRKPKISQECTDLILKIIAPLSRRIKILEIMAAPWFKLADEQSTEQLFASNEPNPRKRSMDLNVLESNIGKETVLKTIYRLESSAI